MRGVVAKWRQTTLNFSSCAQTRHLAASAHQTTPDTSFDCDSHVKDLCNDNNFSEAIHILGQNKRLPQAIELLNRIDRPSPAIYSNLLQLCIQQRAVDLGKKVHAHVKNNVGFKPGLIVYNEILSFYCQCRCFVDARKVFDEMPERDVSSWNILVCGYVKARDLGGARAVFDEMPERDRFSWDAMISGYVRHDQPSDALNLFRIMMEKNDGMGSSNFIVSSALSACLATRSLRGGKEIHGHIVRTGLDSDEVVWTSLLDMYGKYGSVDEAGRIFDKSMNRDVVSWTTMIDRYFEDGRREEGFNLFVEMLSSGIRPNEFTFAGVLNACTSQSAEYLGRQVHGHMFRIGCDPLSSATSALLHMYYKLGNIDNAYRVFKGIPQPDLVSWTFADQPTPETFVNCDSYVKDLCSYTKLPKAIHKLCKIKRFTEAIQLLNRLERPNPAIYVNILFHCIRHRAVDVGKKVHAHAVNNEKFKPGKTQYKRVYHLLLGLYINCHCLDDAHKAFDQMIERDDSFWNVMISGYVRHNQPGEALNLFRILMEKDDDAMLRFIVPRALSACSAARSLRSGKEIHGQIVRKGLENDKMWSQGPDGVWNPLLDMYAKCGGINEARHIIDNLFPSISYLPLGSSSTELSQQNGSSSGFYMFKKHCKVTLLFFIESAKIACSEFSRTMESF